jgi:uncharacterized protein (DUF1697 family)
MARHVAFLRAINVGGHTVKMDQLRALFVSMGFDQVETFIASGNVIFEATAEDSKAIEKQIEAVLRAALGYDVATFVRSMVDVADISAYKSFPDEEMNAAGNTIYIAFLADEPGEQAVQKLQTYTSAFDEFHVHGREVYWLCRKRMSESEFSGAVLEKTLGMLATLRNSNTLNKIAAKYSEDDSG